MESGWLAPGTSHRPPLQVQLQVPPPPSVSIKVTMQRPARATVLRVSPSTSLLSLFLFSSSSSLPRALIDRYTHLHCIENICVDVVPGKPPPSHPHLTQALQVGE